MSKKRFDWDYSKGITANVVDLLTGDDRSFDAGDLPENTSDYTHAYGVGKVMSDRTSQISETRTLADFDAIWESLLNGEIKRKRVRIAKASSKLVVAIQTVYSLKSYAIAEASLEKAIVKKMADDEITRAEALAAIKASKKVKAEMDKAAQAEAVDLDLDFDA